MDRRCCDVLNTILDMTERECLGLLAAMLDDRCIAWHKASVYESDGSLTSDRPSIMPLLHCRVDPDDIICGSGDRIPVRRRDEALLGGSGASDMLIS